MTASPVSMCDHFSVQFDSSAVSTALDDFEGVERLADQEPVENGGVVGEGAVAVVGEGADNVIGEGAVAVVGEGADVVIGEGAVAVVGEGADVVVGERAVAVVGEGADVVVGERADAVVLEDRYLFEPLTSSVFNPNDDVNQIPVDVVENLSEVSLKPQFKDESCVGDTVVGTGFTKSANQADDNEDLDTVRASFFDYQARTPTTAMSQKFAKSETDGVPFFMVHRSDDDLAQLLQNLDNQLMENGTIRLDIFNEELEYDLLFGRKIPVDGDNQGKRLLSGRVGVSFDSLRRSNSRKQKLKQSLKDVEAYVRKRFGDGGDIDKIGFVLRPAGRAEAQLEHVDGNCSNAGKSTTKSVLIPLRRQRSTLFAGARSEEEIMNGAIACPLLERGDVIELDSDKCVHLGYCSGSTPAEDIVSVVIFASISFSTERSSKQGAYVDSSERIGCLPNDVMSTTLSTPPVLKCVCCSRDIIHRRLTKILACALCTQSEPSKLHVVCDACTRWPCDALSSEKLSCLTSGASSSSSLLAFIHRSLVDDYGTTRFCVHPSASRIPIDGRMVIRLYFSDDELFRAARWIIMLHTFNVLDASVVGHYDESVMSFVTRVLGSCDRLLWLTRIMLTFMGIYVMTTHDNCDEGLCFNVDAIDGYIASRKASLRSLITFCAHPTLAHYQVLGQPLEAVLRRNSELKTRCTCPDHETVGCLTKIDSAPRLPTSAQVDPRYNQYANALRNEYEMKCSDKLA